jgi:hypothetical protein
VISAFFCLFGGHPAKVSVDIRVGFFPSIEKRVAKGTFPVHRYGLLTKNKQGGWIGCSVLKYVWGFPNRKVGGVQQENAANGEVKVSLIGSLFKLPHTKVGNL